MKMTSTDSNPRCKGQTKRGNPCRAAATDGGLCFFHANPRKAAELGRIGGRKNSRVHVGSDPLPDLDSATAVCDAVKRVISEVYAGKLNPRTAAGLAPLMNLQLRALEKTDIERRLANVEKQLNDLKSQQAKADQSPKRNDEAIGKYPPQAVKPYGSNHGKGANQS